VDARERVTPAPATPRSGRVLPNGMSLDSPLGEGIVLTRLDAAINWGRKNSLWPMPFGTACCAIEFMGTVSSVFDLSRFGAELVRFSPRQSDLLLVSGTVTYKQAPVLRRIYDQMCEPKWVIAMGVCASSGGFYDNYCTLQGIDKVVPVDYYIAGCPPRPEAVLQALIALQKRIEKNPAPR
jgi:NADH-quinone oxidoreductase subunit B